MIRLAALFVCTVLGAGFATGQEIMRYFADYGAAGLAGVVISSALFGICLYKTQYYDSFEELLSEMPFFAELIIFLSFIVFYSAMISAMSEILFEIFGISQFIICIAAAALVFALTLSGADSIISLSEIICLPMILITLSAGIKLMLMPMEACPSDVCIKGIFSPFIYVSYNLAAALAVVTEHKYKRGLGILSAVLICVTALALALPLYKYYGLVRSAPLPVLSLLPRGEIITYLYLCTIGGAVFTTAVSNSYSAVEYLIKRTGASRAFATAAVSLSALLLSAVGFENIVERVYFIFGITGLFLMARVLMKR